MDLNASFENKKSDMRVWFDEFDRLNYIKSKLKINEIWKRSAKYVVCLLVFVFVSIWVFEWSGFWMVFSWILITFECILMIWMFDEYVTVIYHFRFLFFFYSERTRDFEWVFKSEFEVHLICLRFLSTFENALRMFLKLIWLCMKMLLFDLVWIFCFFFAVLEGYAYCFFLRLVLFQFAINIYHQSRQRFWNFFFVYFSGAVYAGFCFVFVSFNFFLNFFASRKQLCFVLFFFSWVLFAVTFFACVCSLFFLWNYQALFFCVVWVSRRARVCQWSESHFCFVLSVSSYHIWSAVNYFCFFFNVVFAFVSSKIEANIKRKMESILNKRGTKKVVVSKSMKWNEKSFKWMDGWIDTVCVSAWFFGVIFDLLWLSTMEGKSINSSCLHFARRQSFRYVLYFFFFLSAFVCRCVCGCILGRDVILDCFGMFSECIIEM